MHLPCVLTLCEMQTGIELGSSCPFPTTINIAPRAPYIYIYIYIYIVVFLYTDRTQRKVNHINELTLFQSLCRTPTSTRVSTLTFPLMNVLYLSKQGQMEQKLGEFLLLIDRLRVREIARERGGR